MSYFSILVTNLIIPHDFQSYNVNINKNEIQNNESISFDFLLIVHQFKSFIRYRTINMDLINFYSVRILKYFLLFVFIIFCILRINLTKEKPKKENIYFSIFDKKLINYKIKRTFTNILSIKYEVERNNRTKPIVNNFFSGQFLNE